MNLAFELDIYRTKPKPAEQNRSAMYRWCEEKLDGIRICVAKAPRGVFFAFGRKPEYDLWPKLCQKVEGLEEKIRYTRKPIYLDGELIISDGKPFHSSDISSVMAGTLNRPLEYRPFSMLKTTYRYKDMRLRIEDIGFTPPKLLPQFSALGKYAKPVDYHTAALNRYIIENDLEGVVLKLTALRSWYKQKRVNTTDLIVWDVEEGDGANSGKCGVLVLGTFDRTIVGRCKILRAEDRLPISEWEEHYGRVVEVKFDSLTKYNKLRFAQFIRWRPDKPRRECDGKDLQ